MPVNSEHPDYTARKDQWQRTADVIEGSDAVKARQTDYLPRLEGQRSSTPGRDAYAAYLRRALFYNATSRTVEGLIGLIFRKETHIDLPLSEPEEDALLKDITQTGITFDGFSKNVMRQVLAMGRGGILVDMPPAANNQTQGRPFLQLYEASDIVNWQTVRIADMIALSRVVLRESATITDPDDVFVPKAVPQYRELYLDADGRYQVNLWREVKNEATKEPEWVIVDSLTPTIRGTALTFIPFAIANVSSIAANVDKPPLIDMVDVNLSHYRSSADLEHARHFTALPTPWVAGFDSGTVLNIGSGTAWVATDPNAKAGILEFTGAGLSELRNALQDKQKMMAVLGARLLEEQQKDVEAADTIRMRQSGEQSVLRSLANSVSQALTRAMSWVMVWMGEKSTATVRLNTDFLDTRLSPLEQTSLMALAQAGLISWETFYYNMERGEMTRPGVSAEEEKALLAAQVEPAADVVDDVIEGPDTAPAPEYDTEPVGASK